MFLPVVVGLVVLGRAFDLYSISPTEHQIFGQKDIEKNLVVNPQTCSQKHYRVVTSASDVNLVLGLHPGVSLKAKEGIVQLPGLTEYLTTVVDKNNTVEIIMVVDLEIETLTFSNRLPTTGGWREKPQSEVGTHYVSSITYGGRLLVSLRLRPTNPKHLKAIEKAVADKIPASGAIDELFFKDLENVVNSVHSKVNVEYSTLATVRGVRLPTTFAEVVHVVRDFEDIVRRVDRTLLKFELTDLNRVQSNYSKFEENQELESIMEEANEKLEDLRTSEKVLKDWLVTDPTMTDEEEELLKAFSEKLKSAKQALSEAVRNLHFDGKSDQFVEAFATYNNLKVNNPYRYTYTLNKCITIITDKSIFGRMYIWFIKWLRVVLGK